MKTINPLAPFKFWASKPLEIANAYLERYTKDKKTLLDPFAGSGVFVYAALLKGKKAIFNDLCPYAFFLARNAIKPFNVGKIQTAFNKVLLTPLDRDIVTHDGEVVIGKGTKIEEAIKWFYTTVCDAKTKSGNICGREVIVDYFIWDTEYFIEKSKADEYANERLKAGDKRFKIFIEVICEKKIIDVQGKKVKAYVLNRKRLNEKWVEAFEKAPKAWLKFSERKKFEPSVVNEVAAILIRLHIANRLRRHPIEKKIKCPVHGEQLQPLNEADFRKLEIIEKMAYPYPDLIPEHELVYEHEDFKTFFVQYREYQTFVPERLSTIEDEDWKRKVPKLKHYFTKRNLIINSLILWAIMKINDLDLRDQVYLIFVSNLHMTAKFDRLGNYGRWATGYYASLDDFKENNVLNQLVKGWAEIKKVKEFVWESFNSNLKNIHLDETWDVNEFLRYLNEPNTKNVLWLRADARKLDLIIRRQVIDIVFTDPPYRSQQFSVQYYELTAFYIGWLSLDKQWKARYGDLDWWRNEIIENSMQRKDLDFYIDSLGEAFLSINKVVKRNAVWIITYHSISKDVWNGLKDIFESIALKVPTFEEIKTHKIRAKGKGSYYVTRFGSIGEDSYIVLSREEVPKETLRPLKQLDLRDFLKIVFQKMKEETVKNEGIITWEMFVRCYPDVVLKYGGPYGETRSYKELFEGITIELADGLRILDRDKVGDELYQEVYYSVSPEKLVRKTLMLLGKARKKIPRTELDLKILPKINGRVDDKVRVKVLKDLFEYDIIGNAYIFKSVSETLEKYLPKKGKVEISPLPMPAELVLMIKENAIKYGAHKVKELMGDFSLSVITPKITYLLNLNDAAGIRRFAMGSPESEKREKAVVFLHHGAKQKNLQSLAKLLKPSVLVAMPYEKWKDLANAFREYDPMERLKIYIIEV